MNGTQAWGLRRRGRRCRIDLDLVDVSISVGNFDPESGRLDTGPIASHGKTMTQPRMEGSVLAQIFNRSNRDPTRSRIARLRCIHSEISRATHLQNVNAQRTI